MHNDDFDPNDPYIDTAARKSTRAEILELFAEQHELSPTEVSTILGTSILCVRPEITILTKAGKLEKTDEKRSVTRLGRPERVWRYITNA